MKEKKKAAYVTLGCKLNYSETSTLSRMLHEQGFQRVSLNQEPDLVLINTCTVTETASKKCRQAIHRIRRIAPMAKIVAVGCYAQLKPAELAEMPEISMVLGTSEKFQVLQYLNDESQIKEEKIHIHSLGEMQEFNPSFSMGDRTRSFLKIQDGCDYFCSYCTVPLARGRSRSDTISHLVDEASIIAQNGVKEIILTGVNIGDFGKTNGEKLIDLLKVLECVQNIERIRISSIEPNLLTDEIVEWVSQSEIVAPHFHIPLQCGTDKLLSSMRRRYSIDIFKQRVEKIKALMPFACIAADVIVGVPGETDQDFEDSYHFLAGLDISYFHVFTYSERENTLAAVMDGKVDEKLKKERSYRLHELSAQKFKLFCNQNTNAYRTVLFESSNDHGKMYGLTENYIKFETSFKKEQVNTLKKVQIKGFHENGNAFGNFI